jgi:signal transduction histidine kinase
MKVLVIHDQWRDFELLRGLLQDDGYQTIEATDYQQAGKILNSEGIDLILSNIMPGGKGDSFKAYGYETGRHIPFIIYNSSASENLEKFALSLGVDRFISNPFPSALILNSVRELTGKEACHRSMVINDINSDFVLTGSGTYFINIERQDKEALQKSHAELAHVARVLSLGEMTASIAHELSQPLGAVIMNSNACLRLLDNKRSNIAEIREALDATISDALRASEVIKKIRLLVKKSTPEKALLNINEIIKEAIGLAARELSENEVKLRLELAHDLAPAIGDRIQLQQVLLNLILNANDAMKAPNWQPRELTISSRLDAPEGIVVSVRDTGKGLDEQNRYRIFDAFFTTKEDGLGLGLSISRTIIENHGGRLWLAPTNGAGATFQFLIPISKDGEL